MKVDYLVNKRERKSLVFCNNERKHDTEIQDNRLNSNKKIFLLHRNIYTL